ncbi:MAG: valine--tRNA ligase, partial [Bdellovibrio sp.]
VQKSLVDMYKEGDIYRAKHPVFWCVKCKSAIAKSETEEIERETMIYDLEFKIGDEPLLIATTRPELLHAVVAVAVHPDDERYKDKVGSTVTTPLGNEVPLIADKDVDMEFGTGAVMIATFGDKQDVIWMYRHNLPYIKAMDDNGILVNSQWFDGTHVTKAKELVVSKLKELGKVKGEKKLKQVVKVHDRCKKPSELLMSNQWFAKIIPYKKDIEEAAKEMEWHPSFTITYMLDWLNTLEWDWVISRQRHFGTPLPFYYCEKCEKTEAADKLPFYPEKAERKECSCGATMIPETAVADCWIDSSITPLVIAGWPEAGWENYYPSDLRPQGIEIIRSWAFYTTYRCLRLTGKKPFKHILLHGNVLGPDGTKMSKSKGNVVDPAELLSKYSADAVRLWVAFSGSLERDRPFNYDQVKRAQNLVNKIWNSTRFVALSLDGWNKDKEVERTPMDKWILSRLSQVVSNVRSSYGNFEYYKAVSELTTFFWEEFCDYYLEFIKHRIYNGIDKEAAQATLADVMEAVLKLYAPVAPFVTEELYKAVFNPNMSIHTSPMPEPGLVDDESLTYGSFLMSAISEIRRAKKEKGMSIKDNIDVWKLELPQTLQPHKERLEKEIKAIAFVDNIEWS